MTIMERKNVAPEPALNKNRMLNMPRISPCVPNREQVPQMKVSTLLPKGPDRTGMKLRAK